MLEKQVENYLRKVVKENGGKIFKFVSPGNAGVADDIVLMPNSLWFIETKKPTGKLAPLQEYFKKTILKYHYVNYATLHTKEQINAWVKQL